MPDAQTLMTVAEVCDLVRASRQSLARWTRLGFFPQAIRLGPGTIRYRKSDVDQFIANGGVPQPRPGNPFVSAGFWAPNQDDVSPADLAAPEDILQQMATEAQTTLDEMTAENGG